MAEASGAPEIPDIGKDKGRILTRHVWIILILALIFRLTLLFLVVSTDPERVVRPDTNTYELPALGLLKFGKFVKGPDQPHTPELMRTPGYPLFMAAVYAVFSHHRPAFLGFQVLLSVGVIGLTYLTARRMWNEQTGFIAAILIALEPLSNLYSQLLITETFFTFFFVLFVYSCIRLVTQDRAYVKLSLAASLSLCIATLIRPVTYYLFPIVLLWFWFVFRRSALPGKKLILLLMLIVVPWVVIIGGWVARNYRLTGRPVFSFIESYYLLIYQGGGIVALRDGVTLDTAIARLSGDYENRPGLTPAQLDKLYKKEGLRLIRTNPALFLRTRIAGVVRMIVGIGEQQFLIQFGLPQNMKGPVRDLRSMPIRTYVHQWIVETPGVFLLFCYLIGFNLLCLLTFAWGAVATIIKDSPNWVVHLFVWGILAYFVILSAGPQANSRFRVPIMPILLMYSAFGLAGIAHNPPFSSQRKQ